MSGDELGFLKPSEISDSRHASGFGECANGVSQNCIFSDSGDSPLHRAAYKGDISLLSSLISACTDVNVLNRGRRSPLHFTICGNHADAVRLLLSAGANPCLGEDEGDPMVSLPGDVRYLAACLDAQHAMGALIDAGVEIPAGVLERCASLNTVHCMETILDRLSKTGFCDCSIIDGARLAVRQAACCWHVEAVETLLTHVKRFPDKDSPADQTALGEALASASDFEFLCPLECRFNRKLSPERLTDIRRMLIAAGADVEIERNTVFWNEYEEPETVARLLEEGLRHDGQSPEGQTPLLGIVGCVYDDVSLVESFIARGADVNHRDESLRTPMHYAASRTNAEILYKRGADLFAKDKFGMTPLHTASRYGYPDVVQFLLSEGAAVNEPAKSGHTALLYTVYCNENEESHFLSGGAPPAESSGLELAKILLDHGADINVAPPDGETILHGAAWLDDAEFIRHLVEHGANLQAVDANGKLPLHNAACHANIEIVRYLINQGADTRAVTNDGQTTVHHACASPGRMKLPSISQVLETLLDSGVDMNVRDHTGSTALHLLYNRCYSRRRCSPETFNLLLRRGADRTITNNEGENILELIEEDEKWDWDAEGLLKAK